MTTKITTESCKYMKNPDVVVREEDEDGVLLFNPDTDRIWVLNPTAHFIWKQCDGNRTMADIIQAVSDSYANIPNDQFEDQVTTYVSDMVSAGFVGTVEE